MVSQKSVDEQLKAIGFNTKILGRAEVGELKNILLESEKIFECANGTYEGGFALLCATNLRLLLIDKKPLKFLTVEDLRFDMINQIDYSHRILGARINVSAGAKNLKFTSFNQQRLRKLISHIQHRMSEIKLEQSSSAETQQQHLEKINQQLQAYLLAQHRHQEDLIKQLEEAKSAKAGRAAKKQEATDLQRVQPGKELADYLYAQGLLREFNSQANNDNSKEEVKSEVTTPAPAAATLNAPPAAKVDPTPAAAVIPEVNPTSKPSQSEIDLRELLEAGRQEVFGATSRVASFVNGIEVNPIRIAYSKLPMVLRSRRFGTKPKMPHSKFTPHLTPPVSPGSQLSADPF